MSFYIDDELKKTLLKIGALVFLLVFVIFFKTCFYKKVSMNNFQPQKKITNSGKKIKTISLKKDNKGKSNNPGVSVIEMKMLEFPEYQNFRTSLAVKDYSRSLQEMKQLMENPGIQVDVQKLQFVKYNIADIYFYKENFDEAKTLFEKFLKEYPDSIYVENAQAAIEYIKNIDKYKKVYVSPNKDKKGGW